MPQNWSWSYFQYLELIVGYLVCIIVGLFALAVIWKIYDNKIDLTRLLDDNGKASSSRLQLIVFTFVVALSFFLVVISNVKLRQSGIKAVDTPDMPQVPSGVLALLGISASSYLVSKGISKSGGDDQGNAGGTGGQHHPGSGPGTQSPPAVQVGTAGQGQVRP